MSLFPKVEFNARKAHERDVKEKIKIIEGYALDVLNLLKSKDIDLSDVSLILQATQQKVNQLAGELKVSSIL